VQLFDEDVEEVFTWFDRLRTTGSDGSIGISRWPAAGGEADQDDRLLSGLEIVRAVYQEHLEASKPRRANDDE
jgi:hypothetical protein